MPRRYVLLRVRAVEVMKLKPIQMRQFGRERFAPVAHSPVDSVKVVGGGLHETDAAELLDAQTRARERSAALFETVPLSVPGLGARSVVERVVARIASIRKYTTRGKHNG